MLNTSGGTANLMRAFDSAIEQKNRNRARELASLHGAARGIGEIGETLGQKSREDQARAAMNSEADNEGIAPDDPVRQDPEMLWRAIHEKRKARQTQEERGFQVARDATAEDNANARAREAEAAADRRMDTKRGWEMEDAVAQANVAADEAKAKDAREAMIGAQSAKLGGDVIEAGGPSPTMLHGLPSPFAIGMGLLPRREATQMDVRKRFDAAAQSGNPMLLGARDRAMQGRQGLPAPVDPLERQKAMEDIAYKRAQRQEIEGKTAAGPKPPSGPDQTVPSWVADPKAAIPPEATFRQLAMALQFRGDITPRTPSEAEQLRNFRAQLANVLPPEKRIKLANYMENPPRYNKAQQQEMADLQAEALALVSGGATGGGGPQAPAAPTVRPGMSWDEFNR